MAKLIFDEDGLLEEQSCLSCKKAYVENIWYSLCCGEKECPYMPDMDEIKTESEE